MFHRPKRSLLILTLPLIALAWQVESAAAQLTLTWTDSSTNEDGFAIERSPGQTGTFAQIATQGPNLTAFIDSSLASGTTYCYRVRAFNAAGYSDYSNVACGTTPVTYSLSVVRSGTGSGTVSSTPAGITCGSDCSEPYPSGTAVGLAATPAADSTFTGWSGGGCGGTGSCGVTLAGNTMVTATFDVLPPASPTSVLTVTMAGNGSGTVSSTSAGISCGPDCSEPYPSGTTVTLTATPAADSTFAGWKGGICRGKGSCTVTLMADTSVTASFKRNRQGR